jgi:hypothetical protein
MFGHRKPLTDEEYVELTRKRLRLGRQVRWFFPILGLCMLCGLLYIPTMLQRQADLFGASDLAWAGFFLGVVIGVLSGALIWHICICIRHWFDASQGSRNERLMVKYHDALKSRNALDCHGEPLT